MSDNNAGFVGVMANGLIKARWPVLIVLMAFTLLMGYQASKIEPDAGFEKQIPTEHPYMQTYFRYRDDFPAGNNMIIALFTEEGDIFSQKFLDTLAQVTEDVKAIDGVDQGRVSSLFTPDTIYVEVVEGGFAGGNVVPADYEGNKSPAMFQKIKENTIKSGKVGFIVTEDFKGAMITAELLSSNPFTGAKYKPEDIGTALEEKIRDKYEKDGITVHMIGFAKVVDDIVDALPLVGVFLAITAALAAVLLYFYCGSLKLTIIPIVCAVIAVVWQFGLLVTLGFGIDPMGVLVPFLVFAIGVSHGVQMINSYMELVTADGATSQTAASNTLARLLVPASVALVSDTVGFATILLIPIRTIQEMGLSASMGVGVILVTNLLLLPIFLSFAKIKNIEGYTKKVRRRENFGQGLWRALSKLTTPIPALVVIVISGVLYYFGLQIGNNVAIGDLEAGVPELKPESRFNRDMKKVNDNFTIGVDVLRVVAEVPKDSCIRYDVMENLDRFAWHMENMPRVQSALSLAQFAKVVNKGWNEGNEKWKVVPRNRFGMVQAIGPITTSTGLLNADCSAQPFVIFLADHKAETLTTVIQAVKDYDAEYGVDDPTPWAIVRSVGAAKAYLSARDRRNKLLEDYDRLLESQAAAESSDAVEEADEDAPPQITPGELQFSIRDRNKDMDKAISEIFATIESYESPSSPVSAEDEAVNKPILAKVEGVVSGFDPLTADEDETVAFAERVIAAAEEYDPTRSHFVNFALALGNAGTAGATNEVVAGAQLDIVIYVYTAIVVLCLLMFLVQFKSILLAIASTLCVVIPLSLVSALGYAVMVYMDIGLKVATLPVVALGVGIGVDYGIYIFGTMGGLLMQGRTLEQAYLETLQLTGKAVLFTAVTLGLGVGTWLFSDLQFQIDMGKMLAYMFIVNMLAAVLVVPALSCFLIRPLLKKQPAEQA